MRLPALSLTMLLALAACATGHKGPIGASDTARISVGTPRANVISALGQPLSETTQPPGTCLQYETGEAGATQPFYVIITPNDRVYDSGNATCQAVAANG